MCIYKYIYKKQSFLSKKSDAVVNGTPCIYSLHPYLHPTPVMHAL